MKLTEAQRNGLDWLYRDGSARVHYGYQGSGDPALRTMHSLVRLKLANCSVSHDPLRDAFAITDAGRTALHAAADTGEANG
jgi:hypothetical protein